MFLKILSNLPVIGKAIRIVEELQYDVDMMKSRMDVSDALFEEFQDERKSGNYQKSFDEKEPLVSVCIATYNREELLLQRSLWSVVKQDYRNIEIIIVGDGCDDGTDERVRELGDPRVRFVNLKERGKYPDNPEWRWMVAGTLAVNHALDLAKGDFITHLDDDDEYLPDRVGNLVGFAQRYRLDLVWHPFWHEMSAGKWRLRKAEAFRKNQVTTSSVFYHQWFKRIPWDINAYKYAEPGDWNRFRKIKYLGANMARFSEPLLKHYRERSQTKA